MKLLTNLIIVVGFCLGTVGGAGFHAPIGEEPPAETGGLSSVLANTEPNAVLMFAGGFALLFVGGFLARSQKKAALEETGASGGGLKEWLAAQLATIRELVVELDERKADLSPEEMRERISDLLGGEYFDLTDKTEELSGTLGFDAYARVWEGVATAERLLSRVWSMSTDGFHTEGVEELPRARREIERAASAATSL